VGTINDGQRCMSCAIL